MGFCFFLFRFFAISLVLVWCVFLQLCVSSVDHLLFKIVRLGRRASVMFEVLVLFVLSIVPYLFPLNSVVNGGFQEA